MMVASTVEDDYPFRSDDRASRRIPDGPSSAGACSPPSPLGEALKEIEVGFPSASKADFDFVRQLVDEDRIPRDTTIAVLTQARPELIERTYEAIEGVRRAIVHLYNSTSTTQRRVVFRLDEAGIVELAVRGTELVKELASRTETEVVFE